jgi:hypothetical protein
MLSSQVNLQLFSHSIKDFFKFFLFFTDTCKNWNLIEHSSFLHSQTLFLLWEHKCFSMFCDICQVHRPCDAIVKTADTTFHIAISWLVKIVWHCLLLCADKNALNNHLYVSSYIKAAPKWLKPTNTPNGLYSLLVPR